MKPLTDEGREEPGYPEKTPGDDLQKMLHTKAGKFKPNRDSNPHCSIDGRRLRGMLTLYPSTYL